MAVTPARNEAQCLPYLSKSMSSQTTKPVLWLIVDDGSQDSTLELARQYASDCSWVQARLRPDRGRYYRGKGVAEAFLFGVAESTRIIQDWELMAKIDADTELTETYFEEICRRFANNPKLGIASGRNIGEEAISTHPRGNNRVYRRKCWEAIGGLRAISGWDTWDETMARSRGWETIAFEDIPVKHLRPELGTFGYSYQQGKISRFLGYSWYFALGRSLKISYQRNPICGLGYFFGYLAERDKIDDDKFVSLLRAEQQSRIRGLTRVRSE